MPRFRFVVMGAVWLTMFFLFLDRVNISLAAPYLMDELKLNGVEMGSNVGAGSAAGRAFGSKAATSGSGIEFKCGGNPVGGATAKASCRGEPFGR